MPNLAFFIYLMRKNDTANRFREAGSASHWFLAAFMGVAWFGSTILYGASTTTLGQLGRCLGLASVHVSDRDHHASICEALATGEWKKRGAMVQFRVSAAAGVGGPYPGDFCFSSIESDAWMSDLLLRIELLGAIFRNAAG